jgi:hypothetical protein
MKPFLLFAIFALFQSTELLAEIQVSKGFRIEVAHPGVGAGARHMVISDMGTLFVRLRSSQGIIALRDEDGDGRFEKQVGYERPAGTGIKIHKGYLYYSTVTDIFREKLVKGLIDQKGQREQIVSGLTYSGGHGAKPFTFDAKCCCA